MNQLFSRDTVQLRDLRIQVTHNRELVCSLINHWHSWRTAPPGWRVAFLLTDGLVIYGVSTFGRPVARCEEQETTLEHTRMALAPNAPRNSATFFMAQTRKWIRDNMPSVTRLISYVPSDRFSGVTYRGDNWKIVYSNQRTTSKWTNRANRHNVGCKTRTKFEREP